MRAPPRFPIPLRFPAGLRYEGVGFNKRCFYILHWTSSFSKKVSIGTNKKVDRKPQCPAQAVKRGWFRRKRNEKHTQGLKALCWVNVRAKTLLHIL